MINKQVSTTKIVTDDDIRLFANISGDINPVHLDDNYAKSTRFKKRISHGMLVASHISAVIANKLPGPGSIYLSQSLKFLKPVYVNDTVKTVITVLKLKGNIFTLDCECFVDSVSVLKGEAVILKD